MCNNILFYSQPRNQEYYQGIVKNRSNSTLPYSPGTIVYNGRTYALWSDVPSLDDLQRILLPTLCSMTNRNSSRNDLQTSKDSSTSPTLDTPVSNNFVQFFCYEGIVCSTPDSTLPDSPGGIVYNGQIYNLSSEIPSEDNCYRFLFLNPYFENIIPFGESYHRRPFYAASSAGSFSIWKKQPRRKKREIAPSKAEVNSHKKCTQCGTTETCYWRGRGTLCNPCGLKLSKRKTNPCPRRLKRNP